VNAAPRAIACRRAVVTRALDTNAADDAKGEQDRSEEHRTILHAATMAQVNASFHDAYRSANACRHQEKRSTLERDQAVLPCRIRKGRLFRRYRRFFE
jgi:hypothetical protein